MQSTRTHQIKLYTIDMFNAEMLKMRVLPKAKYSVSDE